MALCRLVVSNGSKILIWKQITTTQGEWSKFGGCFQWFKDTNLKANHNLVALCWFSNFVVSNGSKILIWKQITTTFVIGIITTCCFQWFKDTNLKANHNKRSVDMCQLWVVSNGSKILIWKQITTLCLVPRIIIGCFQWFKDTNLKANHNYRVSEDGERLVVSNGSKILIWKQITTYALDCLSTALLFPMVQRY